MSTVQNNLQTSRYEMFVEGQLAGTVQYRMENDQLWLMSTEILPLADGRAVPEEFLLEVLQDLRRRRIEVLPFCAIAREFMMANPRFLGLVPKDPPGHFPLLRDSAALALQMGADMVPANRLKHKRPERKRTAAEANPSAVRSAVAAAK